MKKSEFENKIKDIQFEKIIQDGKIQTYIKNQKEYYRDITRDNLYGCYYNDDIEKYVVFFLDPERGILKELGHYKTEEEAYEALYEKIKKVK